MVRTGRLVGLAAALILFFALATAASAQEAKATIKGSITNKTAGAGAVASQDVTLTTYSGLTEKDKKTAKTDQQGNFVFDGLEIGQELIYQVSLDFQGATYYSQPVMFSAEKTEQALEMLVFDATSTDTVIGSPAKHYLVQPEPGGVIVSEILIVRNSSDKTYVGSTEVKPGAKETLRFPIPAGAESLEYVDGFYESDVFPVEGGFVDTFPIYPGDSQRVFRYWLPAKGDSVEFTAKLTMSADKVSVLMPDAGTQLSVSNLPNKSNPEIQGEKFVMLSGEKLAAGTELTFKLSSLPTAEAAAPQSTSQTLPLVVAGGVAVAVGLVALALVVRRSGRRKPRPEEIEEPEEEALGVDETDETEEGEVDELEAERQDLIASIASLDDAYEQGRIGAEEYGMLRAQQKQQLLEIVARQKDLARGSGDSGAGGPAGPGQPETVAPTDARGEK